MERSAQNSLADLFRNNIRTRRSMIAVGGGALVTAGVGLLGFTGEASAQTGDQGDWRFCNKCFAMFWNGAAGKGHCPAGGGHVAQGFQFSLHFDAARAGANLQYNWRFCNKCSALFFDGDPNKAHCAAGGGHVAQGFVFGMHTAAPPAGANQKDWRFCNKCHALFWDGSAKKGSCAAGGGHAAQGLMFYVSFIDAAANPDKAIADAVDLVLGALQKPAEDWIKQFLGKPDLIGKGFSLYSINFHFGKRNVSVNRPNFSLKLNDNYLYTRMTQPSILGSYADPAFEVHFDGELTGTLVQQGTAKPRVQNVIGRITRITVVPRDVSAGIMTTLAHFFQMTEAGGKLIHRLMDEKLKIDLTNGINDYLQKF